ncbi:hypothetical protein COL922a_007293 [Colletotrichum nupharicola]|nr:hypothetical protein COL922a_007293 [Colletotrichum nupharicola]
MSWAADRETTRPEDMAYCLMGIFDINMPMIYGEGKKAFERLQEHILSSKEDTSLSAESKALERVASLVIHKLGEKVEPDVDLYADLTERDVESRSDLWKVVNGCRFGDSFRGRNLDAERLLIDYKTAKLKGVYQAQRKVQLEKCEALKSQTIIAVFEAKVDGLQVSVSLAVSSISSRSGSKVLEEPYDTDELYDIEELHDVKELHDVEGLDDVDELDDDEQPEDYESRSNDEGREGILAHYYDTLPPRAKL